MRTEAYFIPHCEDNPECDLGSFWYKCPNCGKSTDDYEIWWEEDDIWKGRPFNFQCPYCETALIVKWDMEEHEYYVSKIES